MNQSTFDFELTEFEQATLEAQVSYKASTDADVVRLLNSEKLKSEVKAMVHKWNTKRIKLGLMPFR